jgi:dTDP-glucose 4,6-dehydratase
MSRFWAGKKVLVTGADGFIGSHLVEGLVAEGAEVRAFVYYNSFGSAGWLDETNAETRKTVQLFAGDIRDAGRVHEAVADREIVFHLASLIGIPYSYVAPQSYIETNVGGALNVLNACRRAAVERLVHTSTSEVYGTAQYVPMDEKHPLQGQSPYSASKIGADMLAESFHRSFGVPVAIIRPFNTYGPRQSARAVIPTILSQLLRGAGQLRLGSLAPVRDFNFVLDTVAGFLAVASSPAAVGRVVNVGSGQGVSIAELLELIFEVVGRRAEVLSESARIRPENSEVDRLICNAALAEELTGFKSRYDLKEGLRLTARWVESNLESFRSSGYAI